MNLLLTILLTLWADTGGVSISKINNLKKEAEEAYKSGQYDVAAQKYAYLVDTLLVDDERATINLANAYFKQQNKENALSTYQRLQDAKDPQIKSQAYQQLGVLSKDPQTLEKALAYFKEAIKSNPANNDARYNYELVKKKLQDQQNQDQEQNQDKQDQKEQDKQEQEEKKNEEQQNQDQQNQQEQQEQNNEQQEGEQNKEQQEQEKQQEQNQEGGENKEEKQQEGQQQNEQEEKEGDQKEQQSEQQPGQEEKEGENTEEQTPQQSTAEKLQEMNISEEKARMILEALKNSEIQYIQQNRRKPTKRGDSNKPDW